MASTGLLPLFLYLAAFHPAPYSCHYLPYLLLLYGFCAIPTVCGLVVCGCGFADFHARHLLIWWCWHLVLCKPPRHFPSISGACIFRVLLYSLRRQTGRWLAGSADPLPEGGTAGLLLFCVSLKDVVLLWPLFATFNNMILVLWDGFGCYLLV